VIWTRGFSVGEDILGKQGVEGRIRSSFVDLERRTVALDIHLLFPFLLPSCHSRRVWVASHLPEIARQRPCHWRSHKHSRHWNPHSKQLYFRNGTAAEERELARSSFGRAKDLGIDKFDLVASVYYRQQPENRYRVTPTEREDGTRKAVDGDLDRAVARLLAPKVREEDEGTQKERGQSFIYPLELLGSDPLG
jgi:hypothetical protein